MKLHELTLPQLRFYYLYSRGDKRPRLDLYATDPQDASRKYHKSEEADGYPLDHIFDVEANQWYDIIGITIVRRSKVKRHPETNKVNTTPQLKLF